MLILPPKLSFNMSSLHHHCTPIISCWISYTPLKYSPCSPLASYQSLLPWSSRSGGCKTQTSQVSSALRVPSQVILCDSAHYVSPVPSQTTSLQHAVYISAILKQAQLLDHLRAFLYMVPILCQISFFSHFCSLLNSKLSLPHLASSDLNVNWVGICFLCLSQPFICFPFVP